MITPQVYTYDANGNRSSHKIGTNTHAYTVDANSNRLLSVAAPIARTFSYNGAGNITSDGLATFGYDSRQRLVSVTKSGQTHTYLLNGLGERVKKSGPLVSTGSRHFVYDDGGRLIGEYDASGNAISEYVHAADIVPQSLRSIQCYAD